LVRASEGFAEALTGFKEKKGEEKYRSLEARLIAFPVQSPFQPLLHIAGFMMIFH